MEQRKITRSDLVSMFLRSNLQQASFNFERICNFAFFSGLIGAQFWAERAQPKSPELDAKLLVSC